MVRKTNFIFYKKRVLRIKNKYDSFLILIILGIISYTAIFTLLCSLRYKSFFSYEWEDEAAENQILWNTVHGNFLHQTIYKNKSGIFIDHFNPIYILIAPLYAIFPHIYTLYLLISFSFAVGALPIYLIAKEVLNSKIQACFLSFAYLFYSPMHWINITTIEPSMYSVPLLLFAYYFFYKEKFQYFLKFLILSLMTKENISLIAIMLGVYAIFKKRDLKWIILPFILGIVWFIISVWIIYPMIGPATKNLFNYMGVDSFFELLKRIFLYPKMILDPYYLKPYLIFFLKVFKPVLFLPLLSLEWLISLPIYLELLLIRELPANFRSYALSPIIPFIFIGMIFSFKHIKEFIYSFKKINKKIKIILINCIAICIVISSIISNFGNNLLGFVNEAEIVDKRFISIKNIYDRKFYLMDTDDEIAWKLIRKIPPEASVSVSGDLLVPLSHRAKLLEFAFDDKDDGGGYDYFDVDYILINTKSVYHGGGKYAEIKQQHLAKLNELIAKNTFMVISQEGNFILLKRIKQ